MALGQLPPYRNIERRACRVSLVFAEQVTVQTEMRGIQGIVRRQQKPSGPGIVGSMLERIIRIRREHSYEYASLAETAVGPLFVGRSLGDSGHRKLFFQLGRVF